MNITRDVITDLLPLYDSGEASPDTCALVEEFFRKDPELAAMAREASPLTATDHDPNMEGAMETLIRTKRLLRTRSIFMGVAIFFSLLPFSAAFTGQKLYWAWRDLPAFAVAAAVIGINAWIGYAWTWRRVRTTGL